MHLNENGNKTKPKLELKVNGLKSCDSPRSSGPVQPKDDPWDVFAALQDDGVRWSDYSKKEKCRIFALNLAKIFSLFGFLYIFICSLDLLTSAFQLLGGKAVGTIFQTSDLLQNPVVGVMIGILATVVMQSSSTSTSIVVTMVASGIIQVQTAIPVIMGANIGTSVTNTLVSFTQCSNRNEFRRAFAAATIHDMFNYLSVITFLPLEVLTGYLYHLTDAIIDTMNLEYQSEADVQFLSIITKPFTKLIIQLDKRIITDIATGGGSYKNESMIREWCKDPVTRLDSINYTSTFKSSIDKIIIKNTTITGAEKCGAIFNRLNLGDAITGGILLGISVVALSACLILMVKTLNSMLKGRVAVMVNKAVNANFPGRFAFITGYLCMLIGLTVTILVQSSSVFTSTLTPLAGIGVISIERVYPLTLGSNVGTTATGLLASLAASGPQLRSSIQIALCHLFFNLSGILLYYPIPFMRLPIPLAKLLGSKTAEYRWFSIMYLLVAFLILPGSVFALSIAGPTVLMVVTAPLIIILLMVITINILQSKYPVILPRWLQTWNWLPYCLHSLRPCDNVIIQIRFLCCKYRQCNTKECKYDHQSIANSQTLMMMDCSTEECPV